MSMMNNTLERHKFFPYIAWSLVIGFVVFTYSLTIQLTQATNSLGDATDLKVSTLEDTAE